MGGGPGGGGGKGGGGNDIAKFEPEGIGGIGGGGGGGRGKDAGITDSSPEPNLPVSGNGGGGGGTGKATSSDSVFEDDATSPDRGILGPADHSKNKPQVRECEFSSSKTKYLSRELKGRKEEEVDLLRIDTLEAFQEAEPQ